MTPPTDEDWQKFRGELAAKQSEDSRHLMFLRLHVFTEFMKAHSAIDWNPLASAKNMLFYGEKHHSSKFRVSSEYIDFDIAVMEYPDSGEYGLTINYRERLEYVDAVRGPFTGMQDTIQGRATVEGFCSIAQQLIEVDSR